MDYNSDSWNEDYFSLDAQDPDFLPLDEYSEGAFCYNLFPTDDTTVPSDIPPVGDPSTSVQTPFCASKRSDVIYESPALKPEFPCVPSQVSAINDECFCDSTTGTEKVTEGACWSIDTASFIECAAPPPPMGVETFPPRYGQGLKRKHIESEESDCTDNNEEEGSEEEEEDYKEEEDGDDDNESKYGGQGIQHENCCNRKSICMSNIVKFSRPRKSDGTNGEPPELENEFLNEDGTPKKKRTQTIAQIFERRKQTLWKMSESIEMITGGK